MSWRHRVVFITPHEQMVSQKQSKNHQTSNLHTWDIQVQIQKICWKCKLLDILAATFYKIHKFKVWLIFGELRGYLATCTCIDRVWLETTYKNIKVDNLSF